MKKIALYFIVLTMFACTKENDVLIDSSLPQGGFSAELTGTFVEQNSTGSTGTAELGKDGNGTQFLKFDSDFNTNLGTGTVTVYLSTSMDYVADPGNGNPDLYLIGPVKSAGENYFKLDPAAASKFTYVLLWCGSANIPFGYAALN